MIIIILVMMVGCNKKEQQSKEKQSDIVSDNQIYQSDKKLSAKQLDFGAEGEVTIMALIGDYLYYMQEIPNLDNLYKTPNHRICQYNLLTSKIEEFGVIENFYISMDSFSYINNSIYFTGGVSEYGANSVNVHYQIDIEQKKVVLLREDEWLPLVATFAVNDTEYIEFGAESLQNGYRYLVNSVNTKGIVKEIIRKEDERTQGDGEVIGSVCANDGKVYTYEMHGDNKQYKHYVCSYDLEGKRLSTEPINELEQFLREQEQSEEDVEAVWTMQVFQDYYYFCTLNRNVLLLKKTGKTFQKIKNLSKPNMLLLRPVKSITDNQNEFLFMNTGNNKLYRLFTDTDRYEELNIDLENAGSGVYDNNRLVYMTQEGVAYYVEL